MATREQVTAALQEQLKTEEQVMEFYRKWGGGPDGRWQGEELVRESPKRIAEDASRKGLLDELGIELGLPSDEHAELMRKDRTEARAVRTERMARIALGVAMAALVVSLLVALLK